MWHCCTARTLAVAPLPRTLLCEFGLAAVGLADSVVWW